jgi:hypothetical protein
MINRTLTASLLLLGATACDPAEAAKSGRAAKTEPSKNADNEGSGSEGQATENAEDGGSTDYGAGGDNIIYVVNFADEDICFLYLALDGDWSDDVLGVYALLMDEYDWVSGVPNGYIEVYAEGCESSTWYGGAEVASDYTFLLYGGGGGGGGDTAGGWDSGF